MTIKVYYYYKSQRAHNFLAYITLYLQMLFFPRKGIADMLWIVGPTLLYIWKQWLGKIFDKPFQLHHFGPRVGLVNLHKDQMSEKERYCWRLFSCLWQMGGIKSTSLVGIFSFRNSASRQRTSHGACIFRNPTPGIFDWKQKYQHASNTSAEAGLTHRATHPNIFLSHSPRYIVAMQWNTFKADSI